MTLTQEPVRLRRGLVSALGGVATVIANPVSGHLSDRTAGRYGMRRPWILGGSLTGLAGLLLLALAGSVPWSRSAG
ncbi:hypothetical protein DMB42_12255 [Nonomuraea sp. WAC 01424]|uniref:MFS transporter n=1 Tax=Nonomuraea sp. WAC 01424 TaxID=2203200 RepID=UPI000F770D48|nr:MFS transporter [Nonomuraea sp. WAC 01424]RSN12939.1 hypothetical protein DMB42_12255 [Nonomuraea sp. WAC 01424]